MTNQSKNVTYTFDVFSSLDGFGAHTGDWGGYWGKQGPEFLAHRLSQFSEDQRMVFGANTMRDQLQMLSAGIDPEILDAWVPRMQALPATVISSTMRAPLDWPDATVVGGDPVEIVRRLKTESDVPLRSHGSLALNQTLLAAGLVDYIQLTVFPVLTGRTGVGPIFRGEDFDLELVSAKTFDGNTQELIYRPSLHVAR
ncbi:dihydrofolate reductase family protein [Kribbella sp. NPDC048928]|uniref:dihydrofolate reductase family protein n=1 Tax=Kribbella sp. NPDC048928 TaxID=3364111 RepID=UPI003720C84C